MRPGGHFAQTDAAPERFWHEDVLKTKRARPFAQVRQVQLASVFFGRIPPLTVQFMVSGGGNTVPNSVGCGGKGDMHSNDRGT